MATSFDNLRTVDGILQLSFAAACLELGLIKNEEECRKAMTEAIDMYSFNNFNIYSFEF